MLAMLAAVAVDTAVVVVSGPHADQWRGTAIVWIVLLVAFIVPIAIQLRIVGAAASLLDTLCDPSAMAKRGDDMGLLGPIPKNGLFRSEAILLHRYGVSLVDVGRVDDAAVIRRWLEEDLSYMSKHIKPSRGAYSYCALMCMFLSELCFRLGDESAAESYDEQFHQLLQVARGSMRRADAGLGEAGLVVLGTARALFGRGGAASPLPFSEADVAALENGKVSQRVASEARLALALSAAMRGEDADARRLLARSADAAPLTRAGSVAKRILERSASAKPEPADLEGLRAAVAVDPHAPVKVALPSAK